MHLWKIIRVTASLKYRQPTPTRHQHIHALSYNDVTYIYVVYLQYWKALINVTYVGFSPMLTNHCLMSHIF